MRSIAASIARYLTAVVPRCAGMAAALAILLQVVLSTPLLLRLADVSGPVGLAGVPICSAAATGSGVPRQDHPAPVAHDHTRCLLCQGGLQPWLGTSFAPPAPTYFALEPARAAHRSAMPNTRRRFAGFVPRGPPLRA